MTFFSICLLGRSGRIGCFPVECYVLAVYLSISLVNITNNSINNTWAVINKLHKHPRRTSSLGLVLTDLVRDKEMMEGTVVSCLTLSKFLWLCFWKRSERVQTMCEFTGNCLTWDWFESALGCMAVILGVKTVCLCVGSWEIDKPPNTPTWACTITVAIVWYIL